jgi:hypothetical protein
MHTFITMLGLSVPVWFRHSVARGLSTQPEPERRRKICKIDANIEVYSFKDVVAALR